MMADKIIGLTDLVATFKAMRTDVREKAAPRIVVAGGRVLVRAAKTEAQRLGLRKTGALIRNIAIKRERDAPAGTTEYHVGVRHGRALGNGKKVKKYLAVSKQGRIVTRRENDPFYWRYLQLGTKYRNATPYLEAGLAKDGGQAAVTAMEVTAAKLLLKE